SVGIASHLYAQCFAMRPEDVIIGHAPFYHVGGCIYVTLGTALSGACIALLEHFEPGEALRVIREEGVTCMSGFDTHLRALANHPDFARTDCSGVHKMTLACGPEWYDTVREMGFGSTSVSHHYGFTEGTSVVMPRDETDETIRRNSNGQPFPGVSVRIVDPETGQPCAPDEPGEICIKGWTLFQGYYKMPEQTAESFDDDGYFHSGDYGWMDADGYVYYRGRYKQMIKTGGENVSEREVEMFLEGHPDIRAVQVVGVPDERWGEAVTAMVQTVSGETLSVQALKEFCEGRMAGFKIPKHVVPVGGGEWPITPTGKYDKPKLQAMAMERLGLTSS
ncbi:MAG: acyl--CoA ligase, partial [Ectothiorhodospiraceae bacterium]|nr:acyl--CoA ligase [Ectothiorhodospiraceae bacterium]